MAFGDKRTPEQHKKVDKILTKAAEAISKLGHGANERKEGPRRRPQEG
jgi:hypothetical protein